VGALATTLGLLVDVIAYESFLLLIGSVFVPLFAVVAVDYFLLRRGAWDLSATSRGRLVLTIPWALGFVAYQLINPGTVSWWVALWTAVREALGFTPAPWMSASLLSFAVAALATGVIGWRGRRLAA